MSRPQTGAALPESVTVSMLAAYYGGLLTERQREALRLHCDEDLSLAEIAGQLSVSRQNVHDMITRSTQQLYRYESELHCLRVAGDMRRLLERALRSDDITEIKGLLRQAASRLEGDEYGL